MDIELNKNKVAIAFDIGTTSVGWSIIQYDEDSKGKKINFNILDMGVRLFDDPAESESNTEKRRQYRGIRRRIRRLQQRKKDLMDLCIKEKLVSNKDEFNAYIRNSCFDEEGKEFLPIQIKMKGLKHKLSNHELVLILHNYIKHRGQLVTIDSDDDTDEKERNSARDFYDRNKFPCENQWKWYQISGKVLGNAGNLGISNDDFKKEIEEIFKHQNLSDWFKDQFLSLFERHRHYSEGPGSEKSFSPYGRWLLDENNEWKWRGGNLWDNLIGKCTYYPDEKRNYKKSPITELFNLLNDLGNLVYVNKDGEIKRLSKKEKKEILNSNLSILTLDKICKKFDIDKKDGIHSGFKKDSQGKFEIEKCQSISKIGKWLINKNIREKIDLTDFNDLDLLHKIFEIGASVQSSKERLEEFKNNEYFKNLGWNNLDEEAIKELSEMKIFSSGTSGLSAKAQKDFIKFALSDEGTGKNQMNYFEENINYVQSNKFSKYTYFPENYFANEIMPLTVKRSFNQATKVLNSILKKYSKKHDISYVMIETARELHSKDAKKQIEKELKENKKYLDEKMKEHNVSEELLKKGDNRLKFLLWLEQNKLDLYDGKPIDKDDLLHNPSQYNIDHVLPYSLTFVDSMQNKVLTSAENNHNKGQKTPYEWMSGEDYKSYEERCNKLISELNNDKKRKGKLESKIKHYLLYKGDLLEDLQGFVSRQLNDTRYISREFMKCLKMFFNQSERWKNNKIIVHAINGAITTYARRNLFKESKEEQYLLSKDRDVYNHHAIDASIIGFLGLDQNIFKLLRHKVIKKGDQYYKEGSEDEEPLFAKDDLLNLSNDLEKIALSYRNQMRDFIKENKIKFSRMIISKENSPLANDTLYSLRTYYEIDEKTKEKTKISYKITSLNLLSGNTKIEDLQKYFGDSCNEKELKKLIIYTKEKSLYKKLNDIFIENFDPNEKTNPFQKYAQKKYKEIYEGESNTKDTKEYTDDQINKLIDKLPIFNDQGNQITHWIKSLKIKENKVNEENLLIVKKNQEAKTSRKKKTSFYDSLKPFGVRIYRNNDGKYLTVVLNALTLNWNKYQNKFVPNEEKIRDQLPKDINPNNYILIKKGMTFLGIEDFDNKIEKNKLYYFIGAEKESNRLEIKPVFQLQKDNKRLRLAISTIAKTFKLCSVDTLGNIYNVMSFDEYFDNLIQQQKTLLNK